MKCPNCGAAMRYLSSGEIYYCEYCKYEMPDMEEKPEQEPKVVKEIHHVYETPSRTLQYTRVRKKRIGGKIAILLCFLIPFLVIFFALREIPTGIVILGFLLFLLVKR